MNALQAALRRVNAGRPPVWFMRQAGRYHAHYQRLRERHPFIDLCKDPALACEATLGPVEDFGFDAAILFSDLLFPLEAMGMGLRYEPGPLLDWHLRARGDVARLRGGAELAGELAFQGEAIRRIRERLPRETALIGFVGAPLTLYCYAVEGSHQGGLHDARAGLRDERFGGFVGKLVPLLAENMALQAEARAGDGRTLDAIAVFDTCAGEFAPAEYADFAVPALAEALKRFRAICPETPVIYYSKGTGPAHWERLEGLPIACLGIDWNHDLDRVLLDFGARYAIQGNVDPHWLFLEPRELERRLRSVFARVLALPAAARAGWVCGLGHGVLPRTPEASVRLFLKLQREMFG